MHRQQNRMKMPWGKYKGHYIDKIPSNYLRYVAENWEEDTPFKKDIVEECDEEWKWREANNVHIDD